jgi:hypothetical protein
MTGWISIALLAAVAARPPTVIPVGKLRPMAASPQANDFTLTVSPATINFNATNPGTAPVVAGSPAATATWSALSFGGGNWSLTVQAASPTFTNCSTVPVSAVTVTCTAASVGSLGGSASCAPPAPLSSTQAVPVANGSEGLIALNYSVTISFTLADNWKYIAETSPACTLSLNYLANVP